MVQLTEQNIRDWTYPVLHSSVTSRLCPLSSLRRYQWPVLDVNVMLEEWFSGDLVKTGKVEEE
jgi:hypothetical protein